MELAKIKACICEGAAEAAIMDILLDNHLLIFVSVIRILDSRKENFKLSKAYERKVDVINVITAPEIEMLIIFNEDKYNEFKKSGKKPSIFCKENLKMPNVKSYDFVKSYFGNPKILVQAIKKYNEISKIRKGEYTLLDLLK